MRKRAQYIKIIITISGIAGILLLVIRMLGIFMDFRGEDVVLIAGLVLLGLVFFPLFLIDKRQQDKKINAIIKSYEGRNNRAKEPGTSGQYPRGWGMNDSPFRERRSGLSWGGGNIKAADATRGTRRSFLKR